MIILRKRISLIPNEETQAYFEKAKRLSPDKNDIEYFALALKLHCPIWTNDKQLKKQSTVKIYNTQEILKIVK